MKRDERLDWLKQTRTGYNRLYYFTSPSHALENLRNKWIKLSSFKKCNDIFELSSIDINKKEVRRKHREWIKSVDSNLAFLCLSKEWQNPLMWGYYAERGSGICLVVDVEIKNTRDVCYVEKKLPFSPFPKEWKLKNGNWCEDFLKLCTTKSMPWSHEREARYFVDTKTDCVDKSDAGLTFISLDRKGVELAGIINGPIPSIGRAEIIEACKWVEDLSYFQCRAGFKNFRMELLKKEGMWR